MKVQKICGRPSSLYAWERAQRSLPPIRSPRLESASRAFRTANCARWGIWSEPAERLSAPHFFGTNPEFWILDPATKC